MATKAELEALLAQRLFNKTLNNIDFGGIKDALKTLSPTDTSDLVTAVQTRNPENIGKVIARVIKRFIEAQTAAEAITILADNALDLVEIERVFI